MKRLIVCCDGTWQDSDEGTMSSPTNVTLLARAISQQTRDKTIDQIVLYQPGIGTSLSKLTRVYTGAFGKGLMENVREAYGFISVNWSEGDEIYIFGFSRGAYTARSVAGLISIFGLLTKRGMDGIGKVLDAYRAHLLKDPAQVTKLAAQFERKTAIAPIKFVGVWDTVGSLGIPDLYLFGARAELFDAFLARVNEQYQFSDVSLHPNIEFAMHALGLNEHRAPFTPTLWHLEPDNTRSTMKQCWFPGMHGSIGGGDPTHSLSDITLAWMVQQLTTYTKLEYSVEYLLDSRTTFGPNKMDLPWGCAPYEDTDTGIWELAGSKPRTPNQYLTTDEIARGVKTNETYHKCVAARQQTLGERWPHPSVNGLQQDVFGPVEQQLSWAG